MFYLQRCDSAILVSSSFSTQLRQSNPLPYHQIASHIRITLVSRDFLQQKRCSLWIGDREKGEVERNVSYQSKKRFLK